MQRFSRTEIFSEWLDDMQIDSQIALEPLLGEALAYVVANQISNLMNSHELLDAFEIYLTSHFCYEENLENFYWIKKSSNLKEIV